MEGGDSDGSHIENPAEGAGKSERTIPAFGGKRDAGGKGPGHGSGGLYRQHGRAV